MANSINANGLTPVGTLSGASWSGSVRMVPVDGTGANIFVGDLVILGATGNADVSTAGALHNIGVCVGYPTHQGPLTAGIMNGAVKANEPDRTRSYYRPSVDGAGYILCTVGPDVLYEIMENGNGGFTMVGSNADIVATAGSTVTGTSAHAV